MEELIRHPFAAHGDFIDAVSRSYDIDPRNRLFHTMPKAPRASKPMTQALTKLRRKAMVLIKKLWVMWERSATRGYLE